MFSVLKMLVIALAISVGMTGCNPFQADTTSMAVEILKRNLKSPSSFSLVDAEEKWSGYDKENNPAYVVKLVYDSQNGFGAMIRGCNLVSFAIKGSKFEWNPRLAIQQCEAPPLIDEQMAVQMLVRMNEFTNDAKVSAESKAKPEETSGNSDNSLAAAQPPVPTATPESTNETQASPTPIGQISESRTGRFGTVSIRYDVKTVQGYLYVNDILVPKDLLAVAPSIVQKWDIGPHEVYLLSDNTGGTGCPATYFFLDVQNGGASVSDNFGSCSDEPEMALKNGKIIIHFMKFGTAPESTIRFADGRVFSSEDSGAETTISMTQVKL